MSITQLDNFIKLNDETQIKFLQPDIARYGGISHIMALKDKIINDKLYLHYLGGAVGLITSAHLMSSINQNGFLEYDINENALRTEILKPTVKIKDGYLHLNNKFVNNSQEEQADLETILSQVDEVENNSKLLEAFKNKGSSSEALNNSLTRTENEKFKIIRNRDVTDKTDPGPET